MNVILSTLYLLAAMPSPVTIPQISNSWTPANVPPDAVIEAGSASQSVGLGSAKMVLTSVVQRVASLAALATVKVTSRAPTIIIADGYATAGDGGGGAFIYESGSSATDDGGTIIAPAVGTGRWVRMDSAKFVYPEWWGGFPDNSTDCSAALTAALATGAEVRLSAGTYVLASSVTIPESRAIIGSGQETTTIKFTGTGVALSFTGVVDGNITLQDFTMTATNAGATYAIKGTNGYHISFFRIKVQSGGKFSGGAVNIHTVAPGNAATWSIIACQLLQTGGDGIKIDGDGGTGGIYVAHCRIQGNAGTGINATATPGNELIVISNDIEGNATGAVYADWINGTIMGNHFEQGSGSAIPMVLGTSGAVSGLIIANNAFSGNGTNEVLIDMPGAGGNSGVSITGNNFALASLGAIRYRKIFGFSVTNNSRTNATCPSLIVQASLWPVSEGVMINDQNARGIRFMGNGFDGVSPVRFDPGIIIGGTPDVPGDPGVQICAVLSATKTHDWNSIDASNAAITTISVPGSQMGDVVTCSMDVTITPGQMTAHVSADGTVTVVLANPLPTGGAALDVASGTLRVAVMSFIPRPFDSLPW